jgi:hypothetical protein
MGNIGFADAVPSVAEEFRTVELGDSRLKARVATSVGYLSAAPAAGFPQSLVSEAALEGFYRLVNNSKVSYAALMEPHLEKTVSRAAEAGVVRVLHDTTEVEFPGEAKRKGLGRITRSDQGFLAHVAIAVTTDEIPRPVGALGVECWTRTGPARSKKRGKRRNGGDYARQKDKESLRWGRMVDAVEDKLGERAESIHIMDREADAYPLLTELIDMGSRFVIRVARDRSVIERDGDGEPLDGEGSLRLSEALLTLRPMVTREAKISKRRASTAPRRRHTHPGRETRTVKLHVTARPLFLRRPVYLSHLPETIEVNIVHVNEVDPPAGEDPIAWVLMTNEPIATPEQVQAVVEHYRARWFIEEFFKALKTGCALEARQLESYHALTNALALFMPIAWQMLLLRHWARQSPDAPASCALSRTQQAILHAFQPQKMPQDATVHQALYAVAGLGGHLKHNGTPGWRTLASGMQRLTAYEQVWNVATRATRGKQRGICDQ